jgi:hypothetical protein
VDFASSGNGAALEPGTSYETHFDAPKAGQDLVLVIRTVVFEDHTFEGDAGIAERIRHARWGKKVQYARAVALLDEFLASTDQSIGLGSAQALESKLQRLDTSEETLVSEVKKFSSRSFERGPDSALAQEAIQGGQCGPGINPSRVLRGSTEFAKFHRSDSPIARAKDSV